MGRQSVTGFACFRIGVIFLRTWYCTAMAYPVILFAGRGFNKFSRGQEGRENGVPLTLQMTETRILIRLLWMYFPRNLEFGSASSKLKNFGGGEGVRKHQIPLSVRQCYTAGFQRKCLIVVSVPSNCVEVIEFVIVCVCVCVCVVCDMEKSAAAFLFFVCKEIK
jgi:hypothetical protein